MSVNTIKMIQLVMGECAKYNVTDIYSYASALRSTLMRQSGNNANDELLHITTDFDIRSYTGPTFILVKLSVLEPRRADITVPLQGIYTVDLCGADESKTITIKDGVIVS